MNTIDLLKALSNKITNLLSNTVMKNGDETINGIKRFTSPIRIVDSVEDEALTMQNTSDDNTTIPSSQQMRSFRFIDKNSKILGDIRSVHATNGNVTTQILARNGVSGTEVSGDIHVTALADGTVQTYAPTPPTNDYSTQIATTAFVGAKTSNYLPLAGGLMTGSIRYNGSNMCFHLRGGEDEGNAYLNLYNNLNGGNGQFSLSARNSTTVYNLVGNPSGILTWGGKNVVRTINNVTADSTGNVSLIDSGTDYIRFADGTQICHGQINSSVAANTDNAVTFPKPFNTIFYNVTFGDVQAELANTYLSLPMYKRTSTSVMTVRFSGIGSISWIAVGRWK